MTVTKFTISVSDRVARAAVDMEGRACRTKSAALALLADAACAAVLDKDDRVDLQRLGSLRDVPTNLMVAQRLDQISSAVDTCVTKLNLLSEELVKYRSDCDRAPRDRPIAPPQPPQKPPITPATQATARRESRPTSAIPIGNRAKAKPQAKRAKLSSLSFLRRLFSRRHARPGGSSRKFEE